MRSRGRRTTFSWIALAATVAIASACSSSTMPGDASDVADGALSDGANAEVASDIVINETSVGTDAASESSSGDTSAGMDSGPDVVTTDAPIDVTGMDVPPDAALDVPSGTMQPCGSMSCDPTMDYCSVLGAASPDSGATVDYQCESFAFGCDTDHSCACLQRNLKCFTTCTTTATGIVVTCGF